jgi:Cu/Ag efflux pump CusA
MLSGTRANIAVKVFGDDLNVLRDVNLELVAAFEQLPQLIDVAPEPQIEVPEVKIIPRDDMLAAHGLTRSDLAHFVELGLGGAHVGEVYLGTRERRPLVVRLAEQDRTSLEELNELTLDVPGGARVPLGDVATIQSLSAAYAVSRENVERKSVIAVNVAEGTDLAGAVKAIQQALTAFELPEGVRVEIGGQYESVQTANRLLVVTALLALLAIFGLLYWEFQKWKLAGLVLANLPLALIGGIGAIAVTSGVVNIASIIGLISLFGIATRNGILLISRYEDLRKATGRIDEAMLTQGAVDRLNPIVMTALSTAMALVPLSMQAGESGSEIQSPMAVVILGGLISATVLNLFVMPAMYSLLSRPASSTYS